MIWVAAISFVFLGIVLAPIYLRMIGAFLVVSDPLHEANAVVVLAGGEGERIAHGAQLFQEGFATWYVLTDMRLDAPNSEGQYSGTVKRRAVLLGVPEDRILIAPGTVATTYEEAVAVRSLAEQRGFRSIILVTSPYHTRRARWITNQVFQGTGVSVIVRPSEGASYRAGGWWRTQEGRQQTALEYAKMVAHLLGCRHQGCSR